MTSPSAEPPCDFCGARRCDTITSTAHGWVCDACVRVMVEIVSRDRFGEVTQAALRHAREMEEESA